MAVNSKLHYSDAFVFLSYDNIEAFTKELWLSFTDVKALREKIRKYIAPYVKDDAAFFANLHLITAKLNYYLQKELGEEYHKLHWWIKNIFIFESNRELEYEWHKLCLHLYHNKEIEYNIDSYLRERLAKVGKEYLDKNIIIRNKYNKEEPNFLTDYNQHRYKATSSTNEDTLTTIEVTINRNLFDEAWNNEFQNATYEELENIYQLGNIVMEILDKAQKKKRNPNFPLIFPGLWNKDIMQYYHEVVTHHVNR